MEAVKKPGAQPNRTRSDRIGGNKHNATKHSDQSVYEGGEDRNMRSGDLWFDSVGMLLGETGNILGLDVPVHPNRELHFATFPPNLIKPMILAGTPEKGVCPECRTPWNRVVEKERVATRPGTDTKVTGDSMVDGNRDPQRHVTRTKTVGWEPGCKCGHSITIPAVVADPFAGSGTTLMVARDRRRHAVGCDLNEKYVEIARRRVGGEDPKIF